ncbi:hypothetical protein AUJ66_01120 [Candidatus Desantisbacteria bacterium CG1_02_38_46]|uniref:Uroporphyrinogen decarboxylase (URO-D) domain-containing protein n=2 Tax=unclassified Candidatus Desantisiibacteriota TaxID=3106372 RepID=A0A1J4SJ79_9BACT|nr:MAG: hypothetical protein AUJ66_01120 [Candidatus Desantisbacteria bacterium CG1_02_38_46]PIU51529.1 MAG: hypothetical protein COS91_03900 [Candidatus Desantisbacteria bacterium CG07_land_8_20_14_0_80_39_15]
MSEFYLEEQIDFKKHNEEIAKVLDAYNKGKPIRAPIQFSMNPRMILMNPELNKCGYTWEQYFKDPDIRWEVELEFQKWVRFNVLQDMEMGPPAKEWGGVGLGLQNCEEAAWFGCKIEYPKDDMPFMKPILKEDKKKLYDMTIPDPLSGNIMKMIMEQYEYLNEKRKKTDFEGNPVGATALPLGGTDGPLTVACDLRGVSEVAMDFYEDPEFLRDLLSFITDAEIVRIKKIMEFNKAEYPVQCWGFADDSIELISTEMYKDFILPYHKKLLAEFSKGGPNSIHLCGKVQRHLKFLKDELNIKTFDLGFPTDLGKARQDLGEDVTLIGNIPPHLLKMGPVQKIKDEVKNLCQSGVMKGGKFILHDGNNCAPETSVLHFKAMYEAGREYGRYLEEI